MSINFENPLTDEQIALVKKMFGEPVAADDRHFLYDSMGVIEQRKMSLIARKTKQPVTVEIHDAGEIKTLADGSRYLVTPQGWRKEPK